MAVLFTPFTLRDTTLPNRIVMSPMCQFCSVDALPDAWHLIHYGSRAAGGVGMIICEATAVAPEGRITPGDLGLWSDDQVKAWRSLTAVIEGNGAVPAIQLAHAGIKASANPPARCTQNLGGVSDADGGWQPVGPTADPFSPMERTPRALTADEVMAVPGLFAAAAVRALAAGFRVIEVHAAHGYLLNQFLTPLLNRRTDRFGGDAAGRQWLAVQTVRAVRAAVGESVPILVRISATDWVDGGWTVEDSVRLTAELVSAGADLIDCSSGGTSPSAAIPLAPGYQVPLAARVRADAGVPTGAVGLITEPAQAEAILTDGSADLVLLGRQLLREPHWALRAAAALGASTTEWPTPHPLAIPS